MHTHRPGAPKTVLYWLAMLAMTMFSAQAGAGELDRNGGEPRARASAPDQLAQVCAPVGRRACGFKNGRWRNYRNRCYARRAGARPIRTGRCNAASNCASQPARVVCGTFRGRRVNFRNLCYARRSRATNIRFGRCQPARTCHQRGTSRRYPHIQGRSWNPACRAAPPPRTCHQRGTSRRYPHIQGRSWHPACRAAPAPRTCHQRNTSRRYPHIQGRSWNPACRAGGGGGGGGKPKAGAPCTGKDRYGNPFTGRISIDQQGFASCLGDSSGQPRR